MKLWKIILPLLVLVALGAGVVVSQKKPAEPIKVATSSSQAVSDLPKGVKSSDWKLKLVNKQHMLKQEIGFTQATIDGKVVDARIQKAVTDFMAGAQQAGYATTLVSGYRSIADQTNVYNTSVAQYEAQGKSHAEAVRLTQLVIQTPGASEHHTGLAIDLAGDDALAKYPALEAGMDQFASQQWLMQHAPDYGFVLRYMNTATSRKETGIDYESWHFRYVGVASAKYMTAKNLTLEAYVAELKAAHR